MNLKSGSVNPELSCLNCSVCLYLSNATSHCSWFKGGRVPLPRSHSVMDKPDPVSRVIPPSTICIMIIITPIKSQLATALLFLFIIFCLLGCKGRPVKMEEDDLEQKMCIVNKMMKL